MTSVIRPHELAQLRQSADAIGCAGQPETGRLLHSLLDAYEDADKSNGALETAEEDWDHERDAFRDALKEARGMLERIASLCATASEGDALERHGEARLLAEEAIKDIAAALE